MGWFWRKRDDLSSASSDAVDNFIDQQLQGFVTTNGCTTKVVDRTVCKTTMVWPGKFVRKCEITKEIHCHCPGRSFVHTKTEYTKENLNALPKQGEDENAILPADDGVDVQGQMKSLLETEEGIRGSPEHK